MQPMHLRQEPGVLLEAHQQLRVMALTTHDMMLVAELH